MLVFPAGGVVAAFAGALKFGFLEGAVMRIHVAVLAGFESQAFEQSGLLLGMRHVALLAGNRLVQTGELEGGAAVVKSRRRLE